MVLGIQLELVTMPGMHLAFSRPRILSSYLWNFRVLYILGVIFSLICILQTFPPNPFLLMFFILSKTF